MKSPRLSAPPPPDGWVQPRLAKRFHYFDGWRSRCRRWTRAASAENVAEPPADKVCSRCYWAAPPAARRARIPARAPRTAKPKPAPLLTVPVAPAASQYQRRKAGGNYSPMHPERWPASTLENAAAVGRRVLDAAGIRDELVIGSVLLRALLVLADEAVAAREHRRKVDPS